MVSGPARCNEHLRCDDVLEESGTAARGEDLRRVLRGGGRGSAAAATSVGRTLHRGRDADRSQRVAQELSEERRRQAAGRWWKQCRGELPRREAEERHARVDHRSRVEAVPQGRRTTGAALLPWARA